MNRPEKTVEELLEAARKKMLKNQIHACMKQRLALSLCMLVEHYRDFCPGDFEELKVKSTYAPTGQQYLIRIQPVEGE
jgi:hypothetical protein